MSEMTEVNLNPPDEKESPQPGGDDKVQEQEAQPAPFVQPQSPRPQSELAAANSPGDEAVVPTTVASPGEKVALTALWREAKAFIRDLAIAVLIAVFVIVFVVQPVRVEGTSMLPRLHDGERILVNKLIYRFESIERGDIVVFWYPNDPSKSFIKRVIGLPGETISIRDGAVYANGELLDEPYLDFSFHIRRENLSPLYVREHYYFVMGDNRDSSNDSRQWGLVPEKYIYGKAIFRYWPLSQLGAIE